MFDDVQLTVGLTPGTITGPRGGLAGHTGPFYLATGVSPTDTPALKIVGDGTFCRPATLVRSGSQGSPYSSPFMGTKDRVLSRGHYQSRQDPNVIVTFSCLSSELPPMGQAVGTMFPLESSRYRITDVDWGNLDADVTAERFVTSGDVDAVWAGETADAYDTYWGGYTASDQMIQPLRHA